MIEKVSNTELELLHYMNKKGLFPKVQYKFDKIHVDFAFPKEKLVIEIDGGYHFTEIQGTKDMHREEYIQSLGWTIQHYNSNEVKRDPEKYAWKIKKLINSRRKHIHYKNIETIKYIHKNNYTDKEYNFTPVPNEELRRPPPWFWILLIFLTIIFLLASCS
jgi:very-short-patch-repair endonuclease